MDLFSHYTHSFPRRILHLSRSLSSHDAAFSPPSDVTHTTRQTRVLTYTQDFSASHDLFLSLAKASLLLMFMCGLVVLIRSAVLYNVKRPRPSPPPGGGRSCTSGTKLPFHDTQPYQLPPLKCSASRNMTMGLKRLDHANWLVIDASYLEEHHVRSSLLSHDPASVLRCLPESEADCQQVLIRVGNFLTARYPASFVFSGHGSHQKIHNRLTGEVFALHNNPKPLETAARLAMEDFNILVRDDEGRYRLQASATLFPAGWRMEERIGGTMAELHAPVPSWQEKLGCSVDRYFDHLTPKTPMERTSLFIQTASILFQDKALGASNLAAASAFQVTPAKSLSPSTIQVRRERQTFTSLSLPSPTTNSKPHKSILFTVHTYMCPLTSLPLEQLEELEAQVAGWSEDMGRYKGREVWWGAVKDYVEQRRGKRV